MTDLTAALRTALTEPDAHPFRWMLDGTPCWCVSADEPHEGWVHAPACQTTLRERLAIALTTPQRRNMEHREPYFALGTAMQDSFESRDAERHLRGVAETWASLRRQGYTVAAFEDLGETGSEHWNVPCNHGMAAHNDNGCVDCECTTPGFRSSPVAPR